MMQNFYKLFVSDKEVISSLPKFLHSRMNEERFIKLIGNIRKRLFLRKANNKINKLIN